MILTDIKNIAASQAKPTKTTLSKIQIMLLAYFHTYPKDTVRFYVSGMKLRKNSDAASLVAQRLKAK